MSQKIAVVVPTIRPESWKLFIEAWEPLFEKHEIDLFKVNDAGEFPVCQHFEYPEPTQPGIHTAKDAPWLFNKTDGCRNLGFWAAYKWGAEIIISLDDDVYPVGDPIQDT